MGANLKLKVLSRNHLKYIAMFLMLLDHFAVMWLPESDTLWYVMRFVCGRSAFPIFCVLFVQGFFYTKRPIRHIVDCAVFAILSEIPYDMVTQSGWGGQNVMFTWLLGFSMCYLLSYIFETVTWTKACALSGVVCFVFAYYATIFCVDYLFIGIFSVYAVYLMMKITDGKIAPWKLALIVALIDGMGSGTFWTLPSVLLFFLYDGTKYKKQNSLQKYSFYAFYPVHLLVLALLPL